MIKLKQQGHTGMGLHTNLFFLLWLHGKATLLISLYREGAENFLARPISQNLTKSRYNQR